MNQKISNDVIFRNNDNNIRFLDLPNLIIDLGFTFRRQKGLHT